MASPFVLYLLLSVLGVSSIWKFVFLAILLSLLTIIYALYIFVWITKQDPGSYEMQEIASYISEGT
jgi:Na+/H+-translocating membrane pyrophosphatase